MAAEPRAAVHFNEQERRTVGLCAQALVGMSRFDLAAVLYGLMIESNPQDACAYRALGICFERLDQPEQARAALDRALELDPDDAYARVTRAAVRLAGRDRDGAREDLSRVMGQLGALPAQLAGRARSLHEALARAEAK